MSDVQSSARRRYNALVSSSAVLGVAGVLAFGLSRMNLDDPWAHPSIHLLAAAAASALLVLALRFWTPPFSRWIARVARFVLVGGFAILALGQGLEAVGAFGYDGNRAISSLAVLHGIAVYVGAAGLLLTMLGALLSVVVAAGTRFNLLDSPWFKAGLGLAVVGVVLFLVGGVVFGY